MDDEELKRLKQLAQGLEQSVDGIDRDIERATHQLAAGGDPGQLIGYLQERHSTQLGLMRDLGRVDARLEDLERQAVEREEQPQERQLADQWQERQPMVPEDHLDWFKESLADNRSQSGAHDLAEQRMLDDMEREPAAVDHLDWLSDRR